MPAAASAPPPSSRPSTASRASTPRSPRRQRPTTGRSSASSSYGGNDGNNTVIPYDDYALYAKVRGTTLNIPKDSLLKVNAASQKAAFGLHPSLVELQALYGAGKLAVLANVGTLAAPITPSAVPRRSPAARQPLLALRPAEPVAVSACPDERRPCEHGLGRPDWRTRPRPSTRRDSRWSSPSPASPSSPQASAPGRSCRAAVSRASRVPQRRGLATRPCGRILQAESATTLVGAANAITANGIDDVATLNAALAQASPVKTVFPSTSLGGQLLKISQVIAPRGAEDEPADLLRLARRVRHAHRRAEHAAEPPDAGEPGHRRRSTTRPSSWVSRRT